jgi:SRSO17 transposase
VPRYRKRRSSLRQLVLAATAQTASTITWREGADGEQLVSRFVALRVRPAGIRLRRASRGGELPVRWLLAEWPQGEPEPVKYWLANLPETTPLERLVHLAKLRWRVEHDYRELKDALGLDHFEGRSWQGWHHHVTLVSVAHAFVTLERLDPKSVRRPDHLPGIAGAAIPGRLLGRRLSPLPAQTAAVDGMAAPVSRTYLTEYC